MTGRRYLNGIPRSLWTGKEKAIEDGARRSMPAVRQLDREIKAADRARRDAGLLPHPKDINDPFAGTEYRPCGDNCWHGRTAS